MRDISVVVVFASFRVQSLRLILYITVNPFFDLNVYSKLSGSCWFLFFFHQLAETSNFLQKGFPPPPHIEHHAWFYCKISIIAAALNTSFIMKSVLHRHAIM